MKIGIFTDSHYSSQEITCGKRYNSKSLLKTRQAYSHFQAEQCELVIFLGDLIDKEDSHIKEIENLKEIARVINDSNIPTVCLMGNHDAFAFTVDEFYKILGDCHMPTNKHIEGKNLLFIDACYFKNGNHYGPGDTDWKDTYFPYASEMRGELESLKGEIYIFMHQNIDSSIPENHRLYNAKELREMIEGCGKVKTVYQGHYHPGKQSMENGVRYVTLPAMCENDKAYFVIEI